MMRSDAIINKKTSLLVLFFITLLVYYPANLAEISILDDRDMLRSLEVRDNLSLKSIFFPGTVGGGYYRPLIYLSFWVDKAFFGLSPSWMHLHNVLLHFFNASLLYLILKRFFLKDSEQTPLLAALLFVVHPIATESTNWISGRTDLLMMVFCLIALYTILLYKENSRPLVLVMSLLFSVMAILAKETAIGLFPVLALILFTVESGFKLNYTRNGIFFIFIAISTLVIFSLVTYNYWFSIGFVICLVIYTIYKFKGCFNKIYVFSILGSFILLFSSLFVVRSIVLTSSTSRISQTFKLMFADISYSISTFLGAVGFYFKKFMLPLPLNLAIREIDPLYDLVGLLLLYVVIISILLRRFDTSFFAGGFCMLLPALPLAFGTIAWTGYAERYVYPAMPFWIISFTIAAENWKIALSKRHRLLSLVCTYLLLIVLAFFSFQRSLSWCKNVSILGDAVAQTPGFKLLRGLYITALIEAGRNAEAENQLLEAERLPFIQYDPRFDMKYAQLLLSEYRMEEARKIIEKVEHKIKNKSADYYDLKILYLKLNRAKGNISFSKDIVDLFIKNYEITKNPVYVYFAAQESLLCGNTKKSVELFKLAFNRLPDSSMYKRPAFVLFSKTSTFLE